MHQVIRYWQCLALGKYSIQLPHQMHVFGGPGELLPLAKPCLSSRKYDGGNGRRKRCCLLSVSVFDENDGIMLLHSVRGSSNSILPSIGIPAYGGH